MNQRFRVVNLGVAAAGTQPPPSETHPELADEPFADTVDEICQALRRAAKQKSHEERSNSYERVMKIITSSGQYEDSLYEAMFKYCPDQWEAFKYLTYEIVARRRRGLIRPISPLGPAPVPTPRTRTRPGIPTTRPTGSVWGGVDTPTPGQPATQNTIPTSTSMQTDTSGQPVPTGGGYTSPLQEQIASYETALKEFQKPRPATPSIYDMTYAPGEAEAEVARRRQRPDVATTQCPPGQFWDGRQCRGSVGSMPGLPGGLPGTATANAATLTSPGSFGNYAGMSGRRMNYKIQNL